MTAALVWRFVASYERATPFLAPGAAQIELERPGRYVIWHEHRTVFDGRSFDLPPEMPHGTRYRVVAPGSGSIAVEPYGAMTSEAGTLRSVSVARFDAEMPGRYRVAVEGDFAPRVMAVGPERFWSIVRLVGAVIAVLCLTLGGAIAAGLYGFLREMPEAGPAGHGAAAPEKERSLRQLLAVVYGLQAASLLVGVTLIAAVIIDYLKQREAEETWLASHVRWQIRTFWWSLLWCVVGLATAVFLVGFVVLFGAAVWLVYRVAKGWTELNDGRAV